MREDNRGGDYSLGLNRLTGSAFLQCSVLLAEIGDAGILDVAVDDVAAEIGTSGLGTGSRGVGGRVSEGPELPIAAN